MVRLVREACDHYNDRNPGKRPADPQNVGADPLFVERICVNYLRHALSNYDATRDAIRRLTADPATADQVGAIIKGRTLAAIAEAYPTLAAEARRQAERTDRLSETPAATTKVAARIHTPQNRGSSRPSGRR